MTFFESSSRSKLCLEHDLFRKPVSTFRDHALADWTISRLRADAIQCGHVKTAVPGSFGKRLPSGNAFVTLPEQHDGRACQVIRRPKAELAAASRRGWSGGPRTSCVLTSMALCPSPSWRLNADSPAVISLED